MGNVLSTIVERLVAGKKVRRITHGEEQVIEPTKENITGIVQDIMDGCSNDYIWRNYANDAEHVEEMDEHDDGNTKKESKQKGPFSKFGEIGEGIGKDFATILKGKKSDEVMELASRVSELDDEERERFWSVYLSIELDYGSET